MRLTHVWLVLSVGLMLLPAIAHARAGRVVSTFLCTDEYVFRLLPRDRIAALSNLAGEKPPVPPVVSTIAERVQGITLIAPSTERILERKPDLVVIYQGTNPRLHENLQRAHIPILDVPWANSLADIRTTTLMLGERLGVPARARALIAAMDAKLADARARAFRPAIRTLIYEPNGYATASGYSHEILSAAGLDDIAGSLGTTRLGRIPVEAVVAAAPRLLILNDAKEATAARADLVLNHPALRALKGRSTILRMDLRPLICPGPWSVDVLPSLQAAGRRALATPVAQP